LFSKAHPKGPKGLPSYLQPYQRALDHRGPVFSSLLWADRKRQERRFEVFAEGIDLRWRRIADVGCGRGDLLRWLHRSEIPYGHYVGCDALPDFLEYCRTKVLPSLPARATLLPLDIVVDPAAFTRLVREHGCDTLLISGTLNTMELATATAVVHRAWEAIRKVPQGVLAFNFISAQDGKESAPCSNGVRRFPVFPFMYWAAQASPRVRHRDDYLIGYDFTLFMETGEDRAPLSLPFALSLSKGGR
jgi:SAM-dependent methyltransferase